MSGTTHLEIREHIAGLIEAALGTAPGGSGLLDGGLIRGRRNQVMPEQFKRQAFIYLDYSRPQRAQYKGQPDDWTTRLRIECAARPDDAVPLTGEEAADDLAMQVYGVVMAAVEADPTLGDRAMDVKPMGLAWDTDEANVQLAVTQAVFDVQHRTGAASIAA